MIDLKNLSRAVAAVAEEKGIDPAQVMEAIESSIAAAYKKEYEKRGEIIKAKLNAKTGELKFWQVKTVVDETTVDLTKYEEAEEPDKQKTEEKNGEKKGGVAPVADGILEEEKLPRYNSDRHILIEEAKQIKSDVKLGEELEFPLEPHEDFGRIAAQTAKQVILQRLREAERDSILKEFENREGDVVSGLVQRLERGNVYVDLGRAVGVMFPNETIPGEHYRIGERLRFLILTVQDDARLPGIVLSRAHPKFVSKLFTIEVPEISDGSVEIKAIAREPGSRTKVAVFSKVAGIDPVGSCVGQRGTRVMALSNELGQEKIDIIEWSENAEKFVANSLSPAKAGRVELLDHHEARVYVPEEQLSLAIGKGGQNVRLAARLTGWKIDVRSESKPEESHAEGVANAPADEASDQEKSGE
jgi:N utilization substance protein A